MDSNSQSDTSLVSFRQVWKRFDDVVAARDISLDIHAGEFLSFLGPSGCGKTTLLRMLAGFEQPSEGDVYLQGNRINDVPAYKRPVNMVFQHYALFPHLNIAANVAYGLKQRSPRPSRKDIARQVAEILELVQLDGFQKRRIWEMSGGQQQRVALARALINKPEVLLLDEPLAALDRKLRRDMQIELQTLQRNVGITFILVTHDQEEALSMSDRICIMREGEIIQTGSPRQLYDNPRNRYVADFVGKSNFFDVTVKDLQDQKLMVTLNNGDMINLAVSNEQRPQPDSIVSISVRPEQMILSRSRDNSNSASTVTVDARVRNRIFLGEHTEYLLSADALGEFLVLTPRQRERKEAPFEVNEKVCASWRQDDCLVFTQG